MSAARGQSTRKLVASACLDHCFKYTPAHNPQVYAIHQIEERFKRPGSATLLQNRIDGRLAYTTQSTETKTDLIAGNRCELPFGFVYIRRQDDQTTRQCCNVAGQFATLGNVVDDVVRLVFYRRQQRGHELGRVMSL